MKHYHSWLIAIILLALAVRLHNLTYHSLWFDEAISVHWARQTVPRILEVGFSLVEDRLPPLYYLLLKGWTGIFGFGEAAVRSLSVLLGVLLVPISAAIASLLFGRRTALITAGLVALNPFLIWYAQEARMYAAAVLFGSLSVWAFLKLCERPYFDLKNSSPETNRFRIADACFLLLFILAATAGLYSHLYAGFLLPAVGLWLIISYPRQLKLWLLFALCGLIITAAFAPIAWAVWRFSAEALPGDPASGILQRFWWLIQAFVIWKAPLSNATAAVISTAILLFAACAYLRSQQSSSHIRNPLLLVTLLFLCPFVIANLLLFRNYLAFFGERYFIVMIPWLLILAARGAENVGERLHAQLLRRSSRSEQALSGPSSKLDAPVHFNKLTPIFENSLLLQLLPLILLFMVAFIPVPGQWSTPAAKEAWRQTVAYLARHVSAGDGILIHPDWVRFPFQYYFQGPGETYAAFSTVGPNSDLDGPLRGVVGDHPVIWLVQSHLDAPDPNRLVEQWLASRYPLVTELYPPGIALKAYAPGFQLETLPPDAVPVDIPLENGLHLVGYRADPVASATDALFHPPSGWVHVTLYWMADHPVGAGTTPFVHLVGPEGIWGASLERTNDAFKLAPPDQWPAGAIIRHDLDVNLNPATPPGTYELFIGLAGFDTQFSLGVVEIR